MSCAVNRFQVQYFVAVVKTRTRVSDGSHKQRPRHNSSTQPTQRLFNPLTTTLWRLKPRLWYVLQTMRAAETAGGGVSATIRYHTIRDAIGNESAPIQLAQCRFPVLAISNAKILIYFFSKKIYGSNFVKQPRKLLWLESFRVLFDKIVSVGLYFIW